MHCSLFVASSLRGEHPRDARWQKKLQARAQKNIDGIFAGSYPSI
jgi:hypothetical protein